MVALCRFFPTDSIQVLTEATMPGKYLSQSEGDPSLPPLHLGIEAGQDCSDGALTHTPRLLQPRAPVLHSPSVLILPQPSEKYGRLLSTRDLAEAASLVVDPRVHFRQNVKGWKSCQNSRRLEGYHTLTRLEWPLFAAGC
jgi:hypothetical protein